MKNIVKLPMGRGVVFFDHSVMNRFKAYIQLSPNSKMAGGELFALHPHSNRLIISQATGPYPEDSATYESFRSSPERATQERQALFKRGLHSVGLWHTRPSDNTEPSEVDKETAFTYLDAFEGEMEGFLLVIVGNVLPMTFSVHSAWKGGVWKEFL